MTKRSPVWKYFEKKEDRTSTCTICFKNIKTSGNTINLNGHLNSMHRSIITPQKNNNSCQEINDPVEELTDVNTTAGLPTSNIFNTDTSIALPSPYNHFKRQKTIKQSFDPISSDAEGGIKASKITILIMYMIPKNSQLICIVEGKGFKLLIKTLAPLYNMPSRRSISRKIDIKYETLSGIFKETLATSTNFSLTSDIWTDIQTRSYLGITVHFANSTTFTLKSGILGIYDLSERHTSEYLAEKLKEACFEWRISIDLITAVIIDGASNITKSVELAFGKNYQIPCFAHKLI
ncbi:hypothetical protein AGLY_001197 [Aphis glycines]|uniref:BED-type domain-containing protein n=1 Tax=Aphis glycines TaxID=307491 RepID=A0A6G0U9A1_APHGL|nr:hypothetical protein AGLY_001197 [Aphis glycines]